MALPSTNYRQEYLRHRHYFGQLWKLYENPAIKVSTALLLTIFTIVFFAVFAIRPTLVTIAELLRKIEDQTQTLAELKKKSAALNTAQQEFTAAYENIAILDQYYPEKVNIEEVITFVEAIAASHSIPISKVQFSEVEYTNDPNTNPNPEVPITFSVDARYPELTPFLDDITRLRRLITIDTITFATPEEADDEEQLAGRLRLTITGTIHSYDPNANQPAEPAEAVPADEGEVLGTE